MAASDARPIARKNVAYRVYFPILDADGDLVSGAAGLDSEVSLDGASFADCTNEATEIGSSGMYYLDLTSAEMNADSVLLIVKTSTTGAKTTPICLYPEEAGDVRCDVVQFGGSAGTFSGGRPEVNTTHAAGTAWNSAAIGANTLATDTITGAKLATSAVDKIADQVWDEVTTTHINPDTFGQALRTMRANTAQAGAATTITLDSGASSVDDFYTGCLIVLTSSTGSPQSRLITGYVGSTKVATVSPAWATNPNSTTVFVVLPFAAGGLDAAGVRSAVGLASANLDTQLGSIKTDTGTTILGTLATVAGYIDTEVAAIKAKTDNLPAAPAAVGDCITAAGVRAALGLASANLDTQLTAIPANVLKFDMSTITGEAARSVLNSLRKLMNKWSISGTTLTVYKEDDATPAYTQALTATPGADPITGADTV